MTVNDTDYRYKIGTTAVKIRNDEGVSEVAPLSEITGNAHAVELMKARQLEVTPVMIKEYILNNIEE